MSAASLLRRGKRFLENPLKPRTYKRPVRAYVHYTNQAGELVAFAYDTAPGRIAVLDSRAQRTDNIVTHRVYPGLENGARLLLLPSQCRNGDVLIAASLGDDVQAPRCLAAPRRDRSVRKAVNS